MQPKYWNVDLTNDYALMNVSLTRVEGKTAGEAEQNARTQMAIPLHWRLVKITRA